VHPHTRASFAPLATALVGLATLAVPASSLACSVCGCGDPLLTSSDPAAITGQLRLQLDLEYLRMNAANETDPTSTDQLTQTTYRLNVVWRPSQDLSLTATLPIVHKEMRMVGSGGTTPTSDATGLGDFEVAGRYALWRAVSLGTGRVDELAVTAGTSLPTGANDLQQDGQRIDEHGQPGTGAWGPFAGLAYRHEQGSWLAYGSVAGRVRTENGHQYTYGAALLWSVHGQWFPAKRVALDLGVDGRAAAADRAAGETVPNTGGTLLSLSPGVYVNAWRTTWLFLRGQFPFYKAFRGEQDQLPSFVTGLQVQVF
jgi:hypothetical protein